MLNTLKKSFFFFLIHSNLAKIVREVRVTNRLLSGMKTSK